MARLFSEKLDRPSSFRGARPVSALEPNRTGNRNPLKRVRNVATSQIKVDTSISKPSVLFRSSKPNHSIDFQNGFHFNRYRNPVYVKKTMTNRHPFCTNDGVRDTGPCKSSHIAAAVAKRAGQLRNTQSARPGCAPFAADSGL